MLTHTWLPGILPNHVAAHCTPAPLHLKYIFQCELNRAITALARDPAERGTCWIGVSPAPIRMIVDVKQLSPELQPAPFGDGKVLADSQVPLPEPGVAQDVPRLHS